MTSADDLWGSYITAVSIYLVAREVGIRITLDEGPRVETCASGSTVSPTCVSTGQVKAGSEWVLTHDCSTLGGNSGSPVLSRRTGEGRRRALDGRFLTKNKAVAGATAHEFVAAHKT